jgi:DtxR family Mn-dependent transcriptional regulator
MPGRTTQTASICAKIDTSIKIWYTSFGREAKGLRVEESKENYLEAIYVLSKQNGFVRSVDVANYMEFSKPSVSVAMANLRTALLITVDDAGGIHLTDEGLKQAKQVYERHTLLTRFLIELGVDSDTAQQDACRIEHVISQSSFEKLREHMRKLTD